MKKIILILYVIGLSLSLNAQVENIPLVTVEGEGLIKVKPDYVVLGFKIYKTIKEDANNNPIGFEIFKDEDTKIRLFDFDKKDITESAIQIENSKYVKEVYITIYDLNKLDKIMLELYKLGIKDFHYKDYRLSNFDKYKDQARIKAIDSAKEKATLLAKELGQTIGKAHTIEEVDFRDYNWYNINNKSGLEDLPYTLDSDNYLIEPGQITITSKVKVSFDLIK